MGLRNGKASALERLGWGIAAGFFGVGFWAAGKCWSVGRELEREWGAMGELQGLEAGITRMTLLLERQEGWWMLAAVCGWAALAAESSPSWKRASTWSGNVFVRPRMFPETTATAPNSPMARAVQRIVP